MIDSSQVHSKYRTPFSHILCWVDGTEESCRSAERATRLARSLNAQLSFLVLGKRLGRSEGFNAYARIEGVSTPMPPVINTAVSACVDQAMRFAAELGLESAACLTRSANPVAAICGVARAEGADLIVLGRRHLKFGKPHFNTSMLDRLSNRCALTVLSDG
ncbi:universal stress protein [Paracoccus methylarcula]|uniref:Universal stress protein n=1 Tax=Paracoccus methylarcula TaxID=72022 RepID=A0A3R7NX23_9RHOB|nr:universal stress protein [Paracoccus methylarcula]RNF33995.1 universal stress protein [Paracoccus methylarcula]